MEIDIAANRPIEPSLSDSISVARDTCKLANVVTVPSASDSVSVTRETC